MAVNRHNGFVDCQHRSRTVALYPQRFFKNVVEAAQRPIVPGLTVFIIAGFGSFMPARSLAGARVLGKVRGFADFLGRVEKDHIERMEKTPELFEKHLPRWASRASGHRLSGALLCSQNVTVGRAAISSRCRLQQPQRDAEPNRTHDGAHRWRGLGASVVAWDVIARPDICRVCSRRPLGSKKIELGKVSMRKEIAHALACALGMKLSELVRKAE